MKTAPKVVSVLFLALMAVVYSSRSSVASSVEPPSPATSAGPGIPEGDTGGAGESLTLAKALGLALLKNPKLSAFSYAIRAREARALQEGLLPNPGFAAEVENFGGSGEVAGFDSTEMTFSLSQSIPLSGKLGKKRAVATLEKQVAVWDFEMAKLDVLAEVQTAFVDVLVGQRQVELEEESVGLAEKFRKTVARRVRAGRVSSAETSRAEVSLYRAQMSLLHAQRELDVARRRLTSTWGGEKAVFKQAVGPLDLPRTMPALEQLELRAAKSPFLMRWVSELKQREATVRLEDARRLQDPELSGGLRWLKGTNDLAAVAGLSIPLPIYDRNQGAREEARMRLMQTKQQRREAQRQIFTAISTNYYRFLAIEKEVETLQNHILPQAQKAYEQINKGYLQGRYNFLDVLDAQRTYFGERAKYLQVLVEGFTIVSEIERLIGTSIAFPQAKKG